MCSQFTVCIAHKEVIEKSLGAWTRENNNLLLKDVMSRHVIVSGNLSYLYQHDLPSHFYLI